MTGSTSGPPSLPDERPATPPPFPHETAAPPARPLSPGEPPPVSPRPPFPGLLQGLLLLVLTWLSLLLVAVGALVVFALNGRDLENVDSAPLIIFSNSVGFLMVLVLGTWLARVSPRRLFPFRRFDPRLLVPLVLVSLALFPILGEMESLFRQIPAPGWFVEFRDQVDAAALDMIRRSFWLSAVALVVVAPLTEEFFFRGLLLHGFLGRYGRGRAVWASAVIFAVAHLTPNQFLPAVLLGLFMGWLMAATRNLWLPIIVHFVANSVPLVTVGLGFEDIGSADASATARIAMVAASLVVVAGGLAWLQRLLRSRPALPAG